MRTIILELKIIGHCNIKPVQPCTTLYNIVQLCTTLYNRITKIHYKPIKLLLQWPIIYISIPSQSKYTNSMRRKHAGALN